MLIRITITEKGTNNDLVRDYELELNGDRETKGRILEEMLEVLINSKKPNF